MDTDVNAQTPSRADRARVLRALGDPVRLGVVDLLRVQDLSPDALGSALDVPGNLLAHHLRILEDAGVINRTGSQGDRRRTYVQIVPIALSGLLDPRIDLTASRIVFVCTHNSARSVLADAIWQALSDVPSTSAGTHPADRINPRAVAAAQRADLSLAESAPRWIEDVLRPDDLIVSVCDAVNEELGPLPNQRVHWSIPDPSSVDTDDAFDIALSDITHRVELLSPTIRSRSTASPRRRP